MPRRPSKSTTAKPVGVLRITGAAPSRRRTSTSTPKPSEPKPSDDANNLSLASLTLDTPLKTLLPRPRRVPATPFHFLSLPSELRLKIYAYFFSDIDPVLDLGPGNYKQVHHKLRLMRVCRQVHAEATHFFYSTRTFRLFPTYPGKYFKTKKPLLARMKPLQRQCMTSLELRLGPGWNAPPKGWVVNAALGLKECVNVRQLNVFVECDPSDSVFKGFRRSEGFYEGFSRKLLLDVLAEMPSVSIVEFDAWTSVKKTGGMMQGLMEAATESKMELAWGPSRGWTDAMDEDDDVVHDVHDEFDIGYQGNGQQVSWVMA